MSTKHMVTYLVLAGLVVFMVGGCGSKVSKSNYDKITNGMSVNEVKNILGEPTSEESAGGAIGGLVGAGTIMIWEEGDKKISVTFKDDKVAAKIQTGL